MLCPHDDKITAFADGELDARERANVQAHLGECARCAARVEREQRLAATLRQHWTAAGARERTADCLRDEEIGAFVDGSLPAAKRPHVERHLSECGRCVAEVASLYRTLRAANALPAPQDAQARAAPAGGEARRSFWPRLRDLGFAFAGAAAMLVLVLGFQAMFYGRAKTKTMSAEMAMEMPEAEAPPSARMEAPRAMPAEEALEPRPAAESATDMGVAETEAPKRKRDEVAALRDESETAAADLAREQQPIPTSPRPPDRMFAKPGAPAARAEPAPAKSERPAELAASSASEGGMPGAYEGVRVRPPEAVEKAADVGAESLAAAPPAPTGTPTSAEALVGEPLEAMGGADEMGPKGPLGPAGMAGPGLAESPKPLAAKAPSRAARLETMPRMAADSESKRAVQAQVRSHVPAREFAPAAPPALAKRAAESPDDPEAQLALAIWYLQNGYVAEAQERIERARQLIARERSAAETRPAAVEPPAAPPMKGDAR